MIPYKFLTNISALWIGGSNCIVGMLQAALFLPKLIWLPCSHFELGLVIWSIENNTARLYHGLACCIRLW